MFIVMHVTLVFTTGLQDNLNHIFAARDDGSWTGLWVFLIAMAIATAGWLAATPFTLRHPRLVQKVGFALIGPAQRWFEHLDSKPGQYGEEDISPYFWHNANIPRPRSTRPCRTATSRITACASTDWSRCLSSSASLSYARCLSTNRSPSTSASRAGQASQSGAVFR